MTVPRWLCRLVALLAGPPTGYVSTRRPSTPPPRNPPPDGCTAPKQRPVLELCAGVGEPLESLPTDCGELVESITTKPGPKAWRPRGGITASVKRGGVSPFEAAGVKPEFSGRSGGSFRGTSRRGYEPGPPKPMPPKPSPWKGQIVK